MNTASQVPSGVFTWTLVSTTGSPAAEAELAAATRPAPTDKATKSRRDRSPRESLSFSLSSRLSSIATSSESNYNAVRQSTQFPQYGGANTLAPRCWLSERSPARMPQFVRLHDAFAPEWRPPPRD